MRQTATKLISGTATEIPFISAYPETVLCMGYACIKDEGATPSFCQRLGTNYMFPAFLSARHRKMLMPDNTRKGKNYLKS
jgi:hypothetical protein